MGNFKLINQAKINNLLNLFLGTCLILLQVIVANAQSAPSGTTPAGIAPGSPAGSYPLSGFETVNPYSGNLNFSLPLLQATGRGGMNIPVHLTINQKWVVKRDANDYGGTNYYYVEDNWWNEWFTKDKGYGPGRLVGRRTGHGGGECPGVGWSYYNPSLTRLTFTTPDGTEHELLDRDHGGQPLDTGYCNPGPHGPSRGTIFVTADGTSATFISDEIIYDNLWANEEERLYPSGYLMTKDGTRYRIDFGKVSWQRDRNGNKFTFTYESGGDMARIIKITDSLNREINFEYSVQDIAPYGLCDRITYKGFGRSSRTIRISYKPLNDVLRPGYSLQTGRQLFPYIYQSPSPPGSLVEQLAESQHNPEKVSAVWLPNDDGLPNSVRSYQLRYNSYGELERVELPTGGAIEYKWDDARNLGSGRVFGNFPDNVYRRVIERRVYANGTLENRKTLGGPEWLTDMRGYVLEDQYGADGGVLGQVKHYYRGIYQRSAAPVANNSFQFYQSWRDGQEYQTDFYKEDRFTILRSVAYTWSQTAPAWYTGPSDHAPTNNARLIETTTTLVDTNQISKQTYGYDQYNNQTDVYEYDFGPGAPGALLRRTQTDYLTSNPVNGADYASAIVTYSSIHIRNLPTKQSVFEPNGAAWIERARTTFEYDNYAQNTNHASLIPRLGISGLCTRFTPGGQCIETGNDDATTYQTRGSVTAMTRYLLDANGIVTGSISAYMQYDIAGNVVRSIDARGNATGVDFTDNFGTPDGDAHDHEDPSELASADQKSYALATKVTNALGHSIYSQYDYYLGSVVDGEDANGVVSSTKYDDNLDRPKQVIRRSNNALLSQATFIYDDAARTITSTTDKDNYGDNLLKSQTLYDGLGRTTETRQFESASAYIVITQTYDAMGRVSQTSNPYRLGDQVFLTTTEYDALGRVKKVKTPDEVEVISEYNGSQILVTDQAKKKRLSNTNALGQLTDVWEITPNDQVAYPGISTIQFGEQTLYGYLTHYDYDTLGDLNKVTQGGQTRTFSYNSLKQLKSALNPEVCNAQGVPIPITYDYDENGNLRNKNDARFITTHFEYDALNRPVSMTYVNDTTGTPAVYYKYDSQVLPSGAPVFDRGVSIGRLVAVLYGSETSTTGNYQGFDVLGRVKLSIQRTNDGQADQTYTFSNYTYDLAGHLRSQTYPSGRVVTTEYDQAGRINKVEGQKPGEALKTYASAFTYAAHGAVAQLRLGEARPASEVWEHTVFNVRLQPKEIGLGSSVTDSSKLKLEYDYGTDNNNGNVYKQTITVPGLASSLVQDYTYDHLNRLESASEAGGLSQTFDYDRYGNRAVIAGFRADQTLVPANVQTDYNPNTNRLTTREYDVAGNVTRDGINQGHGYGYDAENRMVKYDGGASNGGSSYYYDGDGRRVKKITGNVATIFVYNVVGQLVAEYCNSNPIGDGGTSYLTLDTLGTPRVITDTDGAVKSRHDYLPFGEEISVDIGGRITAQGYLVDNERVKFTGQQRDNETGLDYFLARYYTGMQARFISPDPYYPIAAVEKKEIFNGYLRQPQNWNRYVYCINNPLIHIDPSGLDWYVKKGDRVGNPEWFEADKAPDPEKYEMVISYVYKSLDSGKYFALNPFANESAQFDTAEEAGSMYTGYVINQALGDAPRLPDAVTVSGGFMTGGLNLTFEAHGNVYFGFDIFPRNPIDESSKNVRGMMRLGGDVSLVWLNQYETPSEDQANRFFTGPSITISGGKYLGGGFTYSPGNGTATRIGLYTPGIGLTGGSAGGDPTGQKTRFRWRN